MDSDIQTSLTLDRQTLLMSPVKRAITLALIAALVGGFLSVTLPSQYRVVGLLFVWITGAGAIGGFFGLLFGIPRSKATHPVSNSQPELPNASSYLPNTNFEEISDWLTKIIVGATLVEMRAIAKALWVIAIGMNVLGDSSALGATLFIGAASTALISGFVWMYLWSRSRLTVLLLDADREGDAIFKNVQQKPPAPDNADGTNKDGGTGSPALREGAASALDRWSNLIGKLSQTFRPAGQPPWIGVMHGMTDAEIYKADFNKGKFGGEPIDSQHGRLLSAVWTPPAAGDETLRVYLIVESMDPIRFPLTGTVQFYLHPTFTTPVITVPTTNSRAMTAIELTEAFTVGVECDGGHTQLELDLETVPGFPPRFGGKQPQP